MITQESFSFYIMLSVLAPIIGAFSLLFLFLFEKRLDQLEKEKNQLLLKQELQEAKYNQLNQQIQPHFFFNTLNVILSLARLNRKEELVSAIEVLSKYFKFKYKQTDPLITMEEEIQYTQYYLDIQRLRFRDRLQIVWNVEESCKSSLVPPYLLQTLVENAFKHGLEKHPGQGKLIIILNEQRKKVYLEVWNSSSSSLDTLDSQKEDRGIGLHNIQKRLQMLFPKEEILIQLNEEAKGTSVQIFWPRMTREDNIT
ncbi:MULTISPECIES: sensor histidine kinase [Rossellomorea]|jgi:two-component system, LytTR family, sensor histidine kinase AlgZ|uniref:sensor histidine kinase n=1 Tax=Rossellomorea TaxID=2837508 RepID=UPI0011E96861|nr:MULTISPECIES: histidine kinase [Rossellomorea]MDT9027236.1 histidine kinase [Rossellomorea sp. YC4-1]TYS89725.1 histidine kinase [Rossellomorea aquimaris]